MNHPSPAHILILDDDAGLLQLARRILERTGYQTSVAISANEAQRQIQSDAPDLVIVDYDLKAIETGLDFVRKLHAQHPALPVILVTGFTDESRVIEALRCGVADVLPKTGDYIEVLPQAVDRLLMQTQLKRQAEEAALLREREQYYRTLAEAIPQLVWTCQPNGDCDFLSKQWVEYTGIPEQRQLGLNWSQIVLHPDDRERTLAAWMAAIAGEAKYDIEYRLLRHDGVYRWFKARGGVLQNAQGKIIKWFGTCTDIEDRQQAEQEREFLLNSERAARTEAERAVRIKDEFVATLSHELRTPLNAIIGWAQLLQRDHSNPDKLGKGLEVITRNAKLQAQMVDDLLDMSRIMSGKLRLEILQLDLNDLITEVIASVQPAADAKAIRLSILLSSPIIVLGDSSRLQQVVWNLVMNAIKFTPKQGNVQVRLCKTGSEAELVVKDTGQGIKTEFVAHVFDRFRQEDGGIARKFGGLGLGLAITRQLVEMHGGKIEAASPGEGLGATFTVHLPLALVQEDDAENPATDETTRAFTDSDPMLDGLHVLLVEDEADGRDLVQRILEERGARVTAVSSAQDALDAYQRRKPDLIVSDIGMPGEDGYQFMRRLRMLETSSGQTTPAAALTALARSEDRRRVLLAGFQSHIAKPVEPLELLVVLASLAGRTGIQA